MKKLSYILSICFSLVSCNTPTETVRQIILLDSGWKFMNREVQDGEKPETETVDWENVDVPHDWAISGEFDMKNDVVVDMVIEDGEKVEKRRTGRTGGLPHVGIG